eukprot:403371340
MASIKTMLNHTNTLVYFQTLLLLLLYFGGLTQATVQTSIDSTTGKVFVSWSAPPNNGAPISAYSIQIQDSDGDWNTEPVMCNGQNLAVVGTRSCLIPMQTLTGIQFNLTWNTLIQVRVAAINSKGTGPYSALIISGARVRTIPQAPSYPLRGIDTTDYQIQATWTALVAGQQTGSSDILSYELYWDNGNQASATIEVIDAQLTSYTIPGLIPNRDYTFKVRARNIYGYGGFSPQSIIKTTDKPHVMDPVSTIQDNLDMILSWAPPQSGGEAINKYQVKLYIPSLDEYVEDLTNCDGSIAPWNTTYTCTFDLVYLNEQYDFVYGDILQGIARAHNIYGWSEYSRINSIGGLILTRPAQMDAPTLGFNTDKDTLEVTWNEMTLDYQTGGSEILSYNLEKYNGTHWIEIVGESSDYTLLSKSIESVSVGTNYKFRIRAENLFGFGPYSEEISLSPIDKPDQMSQVLTELVNTNIKLTWSAPVNNGLAITEYIISIFHHDDTNYSPELTYCNGADATIMSFSYCFIPLSVLRKSPFNLELGDKVRAIAQAKNSKDWSVVSLPTNVNTAAVIITEPKPMVSPTRGANTGPSQIDVRWSEFLISPSNGGVTVTSYNLQWDKGTNGVSWFNLIGFQPPSLATSMIVTNGIFSGQTYLFKVRAYNLIGWGNFSQPFGIKAARAPPQMTQPSTSVDTSTGHFKISWAASLTNGDPIDKYLIEIQALNGTWYSNSMCDGQSLLVIGLRYCLIPMTILRDPLIYGFSRGETPQVRIQAHNYFGWSSLSDVPISNGASIRTEPSSMEKPTDVVELTNGNSITIKWTPLVSPDTGNSQILSYNLIWNQGGASAPSITLVDSLVTFFTVNGLSESISYKFQVRARNIYGYGDYSPVTTITPTDIPAKIDIPTVMVVNMNVKIDWDEPANHGATIDKYEIYILKKDGTFTKDTTNCPGTDPLITLCYIPMTSLITQTSLERDSLIQVKIRAHNDKGWSDYSELNTGIAYIENTPSKMNTPVFDLLQSNNTQVYISFLPLIGSAQGGQSLLVDAYDLQQYDGSSNWNTIQNSTSFSYLQKTGIAGGNTYYFKVRAFNKYGPGIFSSVASIYTSQAPEKPDAPTLSLISDYLKITFVQPTTNFSPIEKYKIEIADENGTFIEDISICNGADSQTMSNKYCLVKMSDLTLYPFYLDQGQLVSARVSAKNSRGWSGISNAGSGQAVLTQPDQMSEPFRGTYTSTNQIQISWSTFSSRRLTDDPTTGGSPVISYNLQWDAGNDQVNWYDLVGLSPAYTSTSYILTSGVTYGKTYYFRVRAKNIYGWGDFSNVMEIRASAAPNQITTVSTSIDSSTGGVKVSWIAPESNGESIDYYTIEIATNPDMTSWKIDSVNCPGTDPSLTSCVIPMLSLQSGDYDYEYGELVQVRIRAHNLQGDSLDSPVLSTGATIRTLPDKMGIPSKGLSTSTYQIQVKWDELTDALDTGNSPILSYNLYWDNGSTYTAVFPILPEFYQVTDTLTLSYIVLNVQGDTPYRFKVRAKNIYGYGEFSDEFPITPQDIPAQVAIPTTENIGQSVYVNWDTPNLNYAGLVQYEILFMKSNGAFGTISTCLGTEQLVKDDTNCTVSMSDVITLTGLSIDQTIKVKIRTRNLIEWGPYSEMNIVGALIQGIPTKMQAPTFDLDQSNTTQAYVKWIALTGAQKGGSALLLNSYDLYWYDSSQTQFIMIYSGTNTFFLHKSLSTNVEYRYYVVATNIYGPSPASTESKYFTAQKPDKPNPPTVTIDGIFIQINWTLPQNNNLQITGYKILIKDYNLNDRENIQYCNGQSSTIITNRFCMIPMAILRSSTGLNLPFKADILVTIQAQNSRGWSEPSLPNILIPKVQKAPGQVQPLKRGALTSPSQIVVNWDELQTIDATGGSPITSYNLQWDAGSNGLNWFSISGLSPANTALTYILTSSLTIGQSYQFKVRARNIHGWGIFSDIKTIQAASAPSQILSVSTQIDPATGGIKVSWLPAYSNGDPITAYKIEFANYQNTLWYTNITYCDGNSLQVRTNLYCIFPMYVFTDDPVLYPFTQKPVFMISAANVYGYGTPSVPYTSGAGIRRVPDKISTIEEGSETTATQLQVEWTPTPNGVFSGYSEILSYRLWYDDGTGDDPNIVLKDDIYSNFTAEGLVGGQPYLFQVQARNIYGYGELSDIYPFTPRDIPSQIGADQVTVTNVALTVVIDWEAPNSNYADISAYQVEFLTSTNGFVEINGCKNLDETSTTCTVQMSAIRTATGLSVDSKIRVRIRAENEQGWGAYSEMNSAGALIQDVPAKMSPPSIVSASVTTTAIPLTWSVPSGAAAGGTGLLILSYELQYSTDGSTWTPIVATITTNSYTHTVTPGSSYLYQIRATNDYGQQSLWSESTTTATVANAKPSAPTAPAITQDGINVVIKWALPTTNHATITSYRIKIQPRDTLTNTLSTTYIENATLCDGSLSTDSLTTQNSVIQSSLKQQLLMQEERAIRHLRCCSIYIQTVPGEMAKPTRLTSSLSSRFELSWSAPTVTGGSSILSYFLEWDAGTSGATWSEIVGYSPLSTLTTYSVTGGTTGLTPGATYGFRLTAYNLFGWGKTGTPEYFKAASKPSVITSVSTSIDSTTGNLVISWTPPNNNGDLITKYLVEVQDKDAPNAWSSPATCVGTSATVLATASCQVPMDTLTSSTYNYDFDNVVLVRVGSENGFSLVTDTIVYTYNIDGAKIRQIPIAMAQPLIPAYTDTYINVTWSALTGADAGNSPITSYALYWNAGAVGVTTATTEVTEALITSYHSLQSLEEELTTSLLSKERIWLW